MIKPNKVSKTYRTDKVETLALKDVDLHVQKGEFVAMMGPSGCGKSTLLNLIGLLDRPGQGSIEVEGLPVTRYKDKQVARLRNQTFGFIFQSFHLIPDLRVIDNVELPLLYRSMNAGERRRLAREALEKDGGDTVLAVIDSADLLGAVAPRQLFTPFFSTKQGGQGIGLMFVREVLTRHGLAYSLASTGQGETRFEIRF